MKITIIAQAKTLESATETTRAYVFTKSVQTVSYSSPAIVKIFTNASFRGDAEGGGLEWVTINDSVVLVPGRVYAVNANSLVSVTLPEAVNGQKLALYNLGSGNWRLQQGLGQQIRLGDKTTTLGQTGRVDAIATGDYLEIVYLSPLWVATDIVGNLEVI